jgi:hypothetical protein
LPTSFASSCEQHLLRDGRELEDRVGRGYLAPMKVARARQFVEAVAAHDFEAAEALLDPDVETVTPRGTLRGIAACRQVLAERAGDDRLGAVEIGGSSTTTAFCASSSWTRLIQI